MVKPEVVVYFGLLLVLKQVGVAESEKRVAAIFLLPVWALVPVWSLAPLRRSFLPYSGPHGRCIVDSRLEMLPRRKSGETSHIL